MIYSMEVAPPIHFMCSLNNNQNKTEQKTSLLQQLRHLAVSKCVCTVCQYIIRAFHRYWDLYFCSLSLRPRTLWEASVTKATVPTGVLFLLLGVIRQAKPNSQETSKTMRPSPRVQSMGAKQARSASVLSLRGAVPSTNRPCPSVVCGRQISH